MVSFSAKKISKETLGDRLKKRREELMFEVDEVSAKLNIPSKYIECLEEGRYDQLPGQGYGKTFLKSYAQLIGLYPSELSKLYDEESRIFENVYKSQDKLRFTSKIKASKFIVLPKLIHLLIVGVAVLALLGYIGYEINKMYAPPQLTILAPADNLITTDQFIEVKGHVTDEASVVINGKQILSDKSGNFSQIIDLQKGVNTIKISARKKQGRESMVYRKVLVNE